MKNSLYIKIYSSTSLTDPALLNLLENEPTIRVYQEYLKCNEIHNDESESIIRFFIENNHGTFLPEKYDLYEPIKESFIANDIAQPVKWLSQPGSNILFKKNKPYNYYLVIENNHFSPVWEGGVFKKSIKNYPYFLKTLRMYIDINKFLKNHSKELLISFYYDLFKVFKGQYGFMMLEDEFKQKNQIASIEKGVNTTKYIGTNIYECLPGIYWINSFGNKYKEILNFGILENKPPIEIRKFEGEGIHIKMDEDFNYYKSRFNDDIEIIKNLNDKAFYQRGQNRDIYVTPWP